MEGEVECGEGSWGCVCADRMGFGWSGMVSWWEGEVWRGFDAILCCHCELFDE